MNKNAKIYHPIIKQTRTSTQRQLIAENKRKKSATSNNRATQTNTRRASADTCRRPDAQNKKNVSKERPVSDYLIQTRSKTQENNKRTPPTLDNTAIERLQFRNSSGTRTQPDAGMGNVASSKLCCCQKASYKYYGHVESDHGITDEVHRTNKQKTETNNESDHQTTDNVHRHNKVGTKNDKQAECENEKNTERRSIISDPCISNAKKSYSTTVQHNEKETGYVKQSNAEVPLEYLNANVDFYQNKIKSNPSGCCIEDMLGWHGDYARLERNHSYIQWLFPLPETNGTNSYAQQLFPHEMEVIQQDDIARGRVLKAYTMMLDFYGMELKSEVSGDVQRSSNWKERYTNLLKYVVT